MRIKCSNQPVNADDSIFDPSSAVWYCNDPSIGYQSNGSKPLHTDPGAFAMMMYGVVFSTVSEAGIPRMMTGTTIGIASIIGYLPDSIYSVIFGKWMDQHGAAGYNYIFTFLMITGIIGAVLAFTIYRLGKKNREQAI